MTSNAKKDADLSLRLDAGLPLSLATLADLGAEYGRLRRARGPSQKDAAAAAGMRQETLSRFERGRGADFSATKLLRLLQVINYRVQFVPAAPRRPTLDTVLEQMRAPAEPVPATERK